LRLVEVRDAEFEGKKAGKEIVSLSYYVIDLEEFCNNFFSRSKWAVKIKNSCEDFSDEAKKAAEFFRFLREKVNREYIYK